MEIKAFHVKNHLSVFVNCLIENPAFDSQTKDTLTTVKKSFGSSAELPEKLIKQVRMARAHSCVCLHCLRRCACVAVVPCLIGFGPLAVLRSPSLGCWIEC